MLIFKPSQMRMKCLFKVRFPNYFFLMTGPVDKWIESFFSSIYGFFFTNKFDFFFQSSFSFQLAYKRENNVATGPSLIKWFAFSLLSLFIWIIFYLQFIHIPPFLSSRHSKCYAHIHYIEKNTGYPSKLLITEHTNLKHVIVMQSYDLLKRRTQLLICMHMNIHINTHTYTCIERHAYILSL